MAVMGIGVDCGEADARRQIMNSVHDVIRERLEGRAGLGRPARKLQFAELERTEWSRRFEQLMRNRLIMGALRYGQMAENKGRKYARIPAALARLQKYLDTGNQEHLVDAANLCLLEFECGTHPLKHFASDDDGEHVKLEGK